MEDLQGNSDELNYFLPFGNKLKRFYLKCTIKNLPQVRFVREPTVSQFNIKNFG